MRSGERVSSARASRRLVKQKRRSSHTHSPPASPQRASLGATLVECLRRFLAVSAVLSPVWVYLPVMDIKQKDISYEELSSSYKEMTVIDVRNRNEMEACGQIPGAHCIPVTEIKYACDLDDNSFKARYGFDKPDCDSPLVVCCKSGVRSKTACDLLRAKGYRGHMIYRGSFSEWEEKGGEVVKPGQPYQFDFEDSEDEETSDSPKTPHQGGSVRNS